MATITDERRSLADLKQHPKNYNVHRGPQIERMAAKVRLNAFTSPFIVTPDGLILGGHLRRLALLHLKDANYPEPQGVDPGWVVPCRVFQGTETQELALLAGDNQHPSDIEFDNEALTSLLAELQADGALEGSGYDAEALDRLIGELAEGDGGGAGDSGLFDGADVDEIPEQVEERCQTGDIWILGGHRLLCGDSTDPRNVERVLDGAIIDTMLTDPPYGLGDTSSKKNNYDVHADTRENLEQIIAAIMPIGERFAERIVLTPGNGNQSIYPVPTWTMAWFTPAGVGRGPWGFCCWQPILCYGKDARLQHGEGCHPDALSHTEAAEDVAHPCSKPVKLWAWLLERVTAKGGDILEPFAGSGTGFIAAEMHGRRCFGIELSPKYCDVILARWERCTGRTAELLERAE